jgi:hypothetical protein
MTYDLKRIRVKTVFGRFVPGSGWCLEPAPGCEEP